MSIHDDNCKWHYIAYATNKDGEGFTSAISIANSPEDFSFRVALYSPDVVISIVKECKTHETL